MRNSSGQKTGSIEKITTRRSIKLLVPVLSAAAILFSVSSASAVPYYNPSYNFTVDIVSDSPISDVGWNGDNFYFKDPAMILSSDGSGPAQSIQHSYSLTFIADPGTAFSSLWFMGVYGYVWGASGSPGEYALRQVYYSLSDELSTPVSSGYFPGNWGSSSGASWGYSQTGYLGLGGMALPSQQFTVNFDASLYLNGRGAARHDAFVIDPVTLSAPLPPPPSSSVPEPSAMLLVGSGLAGMAGVAIKRRRAARQ